MKPELPYLKAKQAIQVLGSLDNYCDFKQTEFEGPITIESSESKTHWLIRYIRNPDWTFNVLQYGGTFEFKYFPHPSKAGVAFGGLVDTADHTSSLINQVKGWAKIIRGLQKLELKSSNQMDGSHNELNPTDALRDIENSLRDFIELQLSKKFGADWLEKCINKERLPSWVSKRNTEDLSFKSGSIEKRLIYYSEFYDLKNIILDYYQHIFNDVFGKQKEFEVLMSILEKFRNPDAHRRDFLRYQKHLILGICGDLKSKMVKYRSFHETGKEYFPRIESVRDNYGTSWNAVNGYSREHEKTVLHPGDEIEYIISASDPEDLVLEYRVFNFTDWQTSKSLKIQLKEKDIAVARQIIIHMRSPREYHASGFEWDELVMFHYDVVPNKI